MALVVSRFRWRGRAAWGTLEPFDQPLFHDLSPAAHAPGEEGDQRPVHHRVVQRPIRLVVPVEDHPAHTGLGQQPSWPATEQHQPGDGANRRPVVRARSRSPARTSVRATPPRMLALHRRRRRRRGSPPADPCSNRPNRCRTRAAVLGAAPIGSWGLGIASHGLSAQAYTSPKPSAPGGSYAVSVWSTTSIAGSASMR